MKKNTLAWFVVAGASIALSGMGMAACSSSSASSVGGGTDASTGGDGSSKDGGGGTDSGGGGDSGGGDSGTCGSTPTLHKTLDDAGHSDIFCSPSTGSPTYCEVEAGANHCCIDTSGTGFPNGQCTAGACSFTKGIDIQCLDDQSCGSGLHCCGIGHPYLNSTCGYEKIFGFQGTTCAADCAANANGIDAGGFQACSQTDTTCASGTCTPTKEYIQLGTCVQ